MDITIILAIIFGIGVLIALIILLRKLPQIRIIEPESAQGGPAAKLKNEIIRQRIERASSKRVEVLQRAIVKPALTGIQNGFRRLAGKLVAVERRYQEKRKLDIAGGMTRELAQEMIEEAKQLTQDEQYDRAEKKLIEVISAHPRNIDAYEKLGRLYLKKSDYESAKETFAFLAKIVPKDASVTASLGEVELGLNKPEKALKYFKKATQLSPNNPKYIDFLAESAILAGDKVIALDAVKKFKELNPESKKIDQFNQRISEINILKK